MSVARTSITVGPTCARVLSSGVPVSRGLNLSARVGSVGDHGHGHGEGNRTEFTTVPKWATRIDVTSQGIITRSHNNGQYLHRSLHFAPFSIGWPHTSHTPTHKQLVTRAGTFTQQIIYYTRHHVTVIVPLLTALGDLRVPPRIRIRTRTRTRLCTRLCPRIDPPNNTAPTSICNSHLDSASLI